MIIETIWESRHDASRRVARWGNKFHLGFFSQSVFVDNSIARVQPRDEVAFTGNVADIRTCARTALTATRTRGITNVALTGRSYFLSGPHVYSRNRGREPRRRVERWVTATAASVLFRENCGALRVFREPALLLSLFQCCRICEDARREMKRVARFSQCR